ncbi:hypothetical protein [Peribacillus simplex]|uniref:hypothetical protein n=1 Tax=Peribacillus simplex TaxID=1478 RepID=UPI00333B1058
MFFSMVGCFENGEFQQPFSIPGSGSTVSAADRDVFRFAVPQNVSAGQFAELYTEPEKNNQLFCDVNEVSYSLASSI